MDSFAGRIAVVTGGGSGMGRELVIQLAREGCAVATCDLRAEALDETIRRGSPGAPADTRITGHLCDVSNEEQVSRFRDEVVREHRTNHVNLVFNNAGIGGGGSFVTDPRDQWERTFGVCWGGVYHVSRAFVPLLIASDDGYLVNTSSVNGFLATLGPGSPHTAYSAAKFAVKGFSEALIEDLRTHAPHVKVAVVMPGHIGTDIVRNSRRVLGVSAPEDMTDDELAELRQVMERRGMSTESATADDLRKTMEAMADGFRDNAPTTAAEAATIILDGVRTGAWRILVGEDAHRLDTQVRADPEGAYAPGVSPFTTFTT
jgi:NAD(P)-dependent dehydrogenase (short-subunit alcohol dehydrogenase family)